MSTFKNKGYGVVLAGVLAMLSMGALSGCGHMDGIKTEAKYPENRDERQRDDDIYGEQETVFGKDKGIFGRSKEKDNAQSALGVNGFLWRATLDTVSFMPLASADPFGGVILTDWYADPKTPRERVKVNAFVMGRDLKADNVRVRTFRQVKKGSTWKDASVNEETARKLEEAILMRARELRIAHLADEE